MFSLRVVTCVARSKIQPEVISARIVARNEHQASPEMLGANELDSPILLYQ